MAELYEQEDYVYTQVPVRIWNHAFDGEDIYTPLHWHRSIELNLVTNGRILYEVDGKVESLEKGEMILINSGTLHSNKWIDQHDHFEGIAVLISKSFLDTWLEKDAVLHLPTHPSDQKLIMDTVIELGRIRARCTEFQKIESMEQIYHLLLLLGKSCLAPPDEQRGRKLKAIDNIKHVINYVDAHYKENLTLQNTALELNYSASHLSRLFKAHIGHNFYEYLQDIRLMNATNMMKNQDNTLLLDCALENGFPNVKSFIETFKKTYGCTPSEWKKTKKR